MNVSDEKKELLKELFNVKDELTESEFKEILRIYNNSVYRIKNKSNKYKCPYCKEYLIKYYEHKNENGTKTIEYKCKNHYYTLEVSE